MKPSMIVIGGSAGSLQTLFVILKMLPRHFDIPILLVIHRGAAGDSSLEELLGLKSQLIAREVEEKEPVASGHLYVCPADYHVLVEPDYCFSLDDSEKVHYSRPSLDVSFASFSEVYREKLVGVVLSGANADGADGMAIIQQNGGITIVQLPADATVPYMPEQVLKLIRPDHILNGEQIGQLLATMI